jgi:phage terminase small subunit
VVTLGGRELNERQKLFCRYYVQENNATRAALLAGYSEKTAYSIGFNLLKKVEIQEENRRLRTEMVKGIGFDKNAWLIEQMKIIGVDVSEIAKVNDGYVSIDPEAVKKYRGAIAGIKQTMNGIEVKVYDKQKALEQVAAVLGFHNEDDADDDKRKVANDWKAAIISMSERRAAQKANGDSNE